MRRIGWVLGICLVSFWARAQEERGIDSLSEVVVSASLRPVLRSKSALVVDTYTPAFLKKNPSPSLFEALQGINGVRPQVNCNVCGTGDIRINGLDGPYTMVTIDGMPMMSVLSTVYGLFGIPNQLIERIEVVKGPASSLYGSEAVAGLINIITKKPGNAPTLAIDAMTTSWQEHLVDLGLRWQAGAKASALTGIHGYHAQQKMDRDADGFTDIPLQSRFSVFQKFQWQRKQNRIFQVAGRYFFEDRWGGETRWTKNWRGSDQIYGESILTRRVEALGNYQLPLPENIQFSFSFNHHEQDSYYGQTHYKANQQVGLGQLVWYLPLKENHALLGWSNRFTRYDDNTPATVHPGTGATQPERTWLPGLFAQYDGHISTHQEWVLGMRWDYHPVHGSVWTPRLAWRWSPHPQHNIRVNAGTGFRVVQLFTEDHAALTGAREVVVLEELKPERSANLQVQYAFQQSFNTGYLRAELTGWYTRFSNQILPDYDTDPNKIYYRNLDGKSIAQGLALNLEYRYRDQFRASLGATLQDVYRYETSSTRQTVKVVPILTEGWSGVWQIGYTFPKLRLTVDYTGSINGAMRLPLLGALDPRKAYSPVWTLQNIQVSWKKARWEWYGGVKNLFDFTPGRGNPFLIARTEDPFDKQVQFDAQGQVLATPENPYALTFDPNYVYAPNQGRRVFFGCRWTLP